MKRMLKGLTHIGDALVITVTALFATVALVATMAYDLLRYVARKR